MSEILPALSARLIVGLTLGVLAAAFSVTLVIETHATDGDGPGVGSVDASARAAAPRPSQ